MNGTRAAGEFLLIIAVFGPMLAAIMAYIAGKKNERSGDAFLITAVSLSFALSILLALNHTGTELRLIDHGPLALHFRLDGFRALYGSAAAFLWLVTSLFSPGYFAESRNRSRYRLFNLLTLGATMGVFFSADFRTTFIFFEIMSLTSYALVAHDETPDAMRAAETYLAIAIMGGLAILMGMLLLQQQTGTLEFAGLYEKCSGLRDRSLLYLPGALMIAGFGAKAGMFPLHVWLPKAHPAAPAPASALLSGILIKTGVFGVAAVSGNIFFHDYLWGTVLLIPAVITMILGAVLAVFSNHLKRTLACSSVSQIGFILTGIALQVLLGEQNAFAVRGTLLYMLNHSLVKLVLFVAAGVVYMNHHELELDRIRGFGRGKPLFLFVFIMSALSISGLPFLGGYTGKTLLHESLGEAINMYRGLSPETILRLTYAAFLFTGGLTIAYMIKLFVALFMGQSGETGITVKEKHYIRPAPAAALALSAALLPLLGCITPLTDALAEWGQGFFNANNPDKTLQYFSWEKIKSSALSAGYGIIIYIIVVRGLLMRRKDGKVYPLIWPKRLDLEDLIYRPLLKIVYQIICFLAGITASLPTAALRRPGWEEPASIGGFTFNLLLAGAGVFIALVYLFSRALG